MTCTVSQSKLDGFIDNELNASDKMAMNAHVMECEKCQSRLATLEQSKQLIAQLTPPPMSMNFDAKLNAKIAEIDKQNANHNVVALPKRFRFAIPAVAASVALTIAIMSRMMWSYGPIDDDYLALDGSLPLIEVGLPAAKDINSIQVNSAAEKAIVWSDEDIDSFDRFTQVNDEFQEFSCGSTVGDKGCDLSPELQVASLTISSSI